MVEFRIDVIVDPSRARRGTRAVQRDLAGLERQAEALRTSISRAFAFVGAGLGARELLQLADAYTTVQNRIRTVTSSEAELQAVTSEVFDIASRTRSAFDATAEVYTRTALAARELGVSQRELLQFTESLNQAVILSGAGAQEARNALVQLSQGIASGALRGDELRSVLEQLPVVADVIAESLGVTRGQLRELGAEGKISAEVVLQAFREAREELEGRFAEAVPTVGQSFTVLQNEVTRIIGEFDQANGATRSLAEGILFLAKNAEVVVRVVAGLGATLTTVFTSRALFAGVAALVNPLTLIPALLAAGTGALIGFGDQIVVSSDGMTTLKDVAEATFEFIRTYGPDAIEVVIAAVQTLGDVTRRIFTEVNTVLSAGARSVRELLTGNVDAANQASARVQQAQLNIENTIKAFPDIFESNLKKVDLSQLIDPNLNALVDTGLEAGQETGLAVAKGIGDGFSIDAILDRARELGQQAAAEAARAAETQQAALAGLATPAAAPARAAAAGPSPFDQVLKDLQEEANLIGLSNREREIAIELRRIEAALAKEGTDLLPGQRMQIEEALRLNQALADQAEIVEQILGPQRNLEVAQAALSAAYRDGRISLDQYEDSLLGFQLQALEGATDAASGAERAFLRIQLAARDHGRVVEDTILTAYDAASDAIADFALSGFQDLQSLQEAASQIFAQIAADLAKLAIQQGLSELFPSSTTQQQGGGGDTTASTIGLITTLLSLFGGAADGTLNAQADKPIVVGERGPELFRPRTSGSILPTEQLAAMMSGPSGGSAAAPVVNVPAPSVTLVLNQTPNESFVENRVERYFDSSRGQKKFVETAGKNKRQMKEVTS